jgi:flagellar motor switch protein FliN
VNGETSAPRDAAALDLLMHVSLPLSVELGRRTMTLADILNLGTGSVVELDRSAAAPVDVLVAGTFVARGEIVAVGDNFGIRVTELAGSVRRRMDQ